VSHDQHLSSVRTFRFAVVGSERIERSLSMTDPAAQLVAQLAQVLKPAAGASSDRRLVYTADVRCLSCTRFVGMLLSTASPFPAFVAFRRALGPAQWPFAWRSLRCSDCGGNTMYEDVEQYWIYTPVDRLADRPRRGRPPKRLTKSASNLDNAPTANRTH